MNKKIQWLSLWRVWLTLAFLAGSFALEARTLVSPKSEELMPIWLQILLPIVIALLIYFVIKGLIRRRNMNKEEVIFRKESGQIPQTRRKAPQRRPKQESDEWTFPRRDEKTGEPIKLPKGANWGMIVFALAILKALSRCLAG